jgi:hypothetical protein
VSGWASELVQTAYGEFVQALTGYSIYPALRDKGIGLSFDQAGNVTIPGRTAAAPAAASSVKASRSASVASPRTRSA